MVSCELADPFGHSRPRLTGESGSPSIWMTLPSLTYTFCPQPTAQYGQAGYGVGIADPGGQPLAALALDRRAQAEPVVLGHLTVDRP